MGRPSPRVRSSGCRPGARTSRVIIAVPPASVASGRGVGLTAVDTPRAAAFANAWLADLLDLEDTYKVGGGHPGATVVPAALAMADREGATGSEIMASLVAGYEVVNRLAFALFPHQGHHVLTTGTAVA